MSRAKKSRGKSESKPQEASEQPVAEGITPEATGPEDAAPHADDESAEVDAGVDVEQNDVVSADELIADIMAAKLEFPEDPTVAMQEKLREAENRVLRSQAELENYRKRIAREMRDERRYAQMPLLRDLLPAMDNLNRAIEAAEGSHDTAGLLEGVHMVASQLEDVLKKHDCIKIEALGEPFDPHQHEAITQQPSDEHPENTVLLVTQTGFQLHDRVVRPSQVIVSTTK